MSGKWVILPTILHNGISWRGLGSRLSDEFDYETYIYLVLGSEQGEDKVIRDIFLSIIDMIPTSSIQIFLPHHEGFNSVMEYFGFEDTPSFAMVTSKTVVDGNVAPYWRFKPCFFGPFSQNPEELKDFLIKLHTICEQKGIDSGTEDTILNDIAKLLSGFWDQIKDCVEYGEHVYH